MLRNFGDLRSYRSTSTSSFEIFLYIDVMCPRGVGFSIFSMSRISRVAPTSSWFPCFTLRCVFSAVVVSFPRLSTQVITALHFLHVATRSSPCGIWKNFQQGVCSLTLRKRDVCFFTFFTTPSSRNSRSSSEICNFSSSSEVICGFETLFFLFCCTFSAMGNVVTIFIATM